MPHTYIHTEPFIWRTASTVHVESEALEAVARRPTIWRCNKFSVTVGLGLWLRKGGGGGRATPRDHGFVGETDRVTPHE